MVQDQKSVRATAKLRKQIVRKLKMLVSFLNFVQHFERPNRVLMRFLKGKDTMKVHWATH